MEIYLNVSGTLATIKAKQFKFPIDSKGEIWNISSNGTQFEDYSRVTQTYFVEAGMNP